ncbi:hypothetical protein AACH10_13745 [Ideonella sp. DXS22W]|uniref:Uncharacterized protein n=1 Tax=Pseudaquabacterium inlustre TaxID=2984192 RepID=A0ABU9CHH8_9BURK
MTHPSHVPSSVASPGAARTARILRAAGPAIGHWAVIAAALAFGLLECLALARSRWQDRRHQRLAAAD